jgi:hypothetical protein
MNRFLALALALAVTLVALPASAKDMVGSSNPSWAENPARTYESSQWFAFELKFGPYTPNIDSSPGLMGHPFRDLFTNQNDMPPHEPSPKLLTQVEFDFQFLHRHGSLGVGATLGIYNRWTHSFNFADSATGASCVVPNCQRSGDVTNLWILPMSLLAVYRWDWLALRYKVPLVPYFKIGLAYYIWWITTGSGGVSTFTDINGKKQDGAGGTFGWVLNPGISFLLDVIDPPAAKTMDAEIGINHTYLFIELNYADISGFGAANKMVLSDTTFNAGIAFEF